MSADPKPKSGLKWILGGVGCFTLLILLCVGGAAYFLYTTMDKISNNSAFLEAVGEIETSPSVADAVGGPVTVALAPDTPPQPVSAGERMSVTYDCDVKGSNKTGKAEIKVSGPMFGNDEWTVDKITVTVDGEEIPVKEMNFDLDIDMGTETE